MKIINLLTIKLIILASIISILYSCSNDESIEKSNHKLQQYCSCILNNIDSLTLFYSDHLSSPCDTIIAGLSKDIIDTSQVVIDLGKQIDDKIIKNINKHLIFHSEWETVNQGRATLLNFDGAVVNITELAFSYDWFYWEEYDNSTHDYSISKKNNNEFYVDIHFENGDSYYKLEMQTDSSYVLSQGNEIYKPNNSNLKK